MSGGTNGGGLVNSGFANSTGLERLEGAFTGRKSQGRKALVIYLMAGDPTVEFTISLVPRIAEAGADVVELGFPFSDPIADGPVIQAAGNRALRHFSGLDDYLAMVARIRKATPVPLVLMTHYNPIFRYGEEAFLQSAAKAGLDGAILPDLPVDEAEDWTALARANGVAPVMLEAPNTDDAHARRIAERSAGFIYMVSLKGVTGTDVGMGENLAGRVERFRAMGTATPLAVGFGISTPEQAKRIGALCDGVIVGTGIINRITAAPNTGAAINAAVDYVAELRAALDQPA
ncbi:MAG: tryptophan synthase subunit alpha [SAR324 cluster bacterium]|nr:tryptophan synthase subunit alpha [SAR324 cluster bacterium]MCH8887825.1 tryptophan synthase subunit alpha [SAR324 cluster bacterium]